MDHEPNPGFEALAFRVKAIEGIVAYGAGRGLRGGVCFIDREMDRTRAFHWTTCLLGVYICLERNTSFSGFVERLLQS